MFRFTTLLLIAATLLTCGLAQTNAQEMEIFCVVRELEDVEIPARRDGVLENVHVRRGHMVEGKQLIAEQDRSVTQLELNVANAQLKKAVAKARSQGEVQIAKASVARADQEKKLVAELGSEARYLERFRMHNNLEKAKAELLTANNSLGQDQLDVGVRSAEAEVLKNDIKLANLYSPVDGVVRELKKFQGEWVAKGEPVMVVTRMDTLLAEGFLESTNIDINSVIGAPAILTFNVGGRENAHSIEGLVVQHAAPKVELDGKFLVWVEVSNRLVETASGDKNWLLRPGMRASLKLQLDDKSPAQTVKRRPSRSKSLVGSR